MDGKSARFERYGGMRWSATGCKRGASDGNDDANLIFLLSPLLPSAPFPSLNTPPFDRQPRQARMAGSGEKADRRPIDPPPIIRLRIRKPHARDVPEEHLSDEDLVTPTLTHTLFMFASLIPENSEEELYDITGSKSKLVAGSVVSSLFHLKDESSFVFPDLSVRTEGRWRFKLSLFELGECVAFSPFFLFFLLIDLSFVQGWRHLLQRHHY